MHKNNFNLIKVNIVILSKYNGVYYGKFKCFGTKRKHEKQMIELEDVYYFSGNKRGVYHYNSANLPRNIGKKIVVNIPNIENMKKNDVLRFLDEKS